jgi:hydroxymethylglutaryl-CoA lyase
MTERKSGIKIIECPRDAMQGIKEFIHTETKIFYINSLLKAGFDTIDFGSFVSASAIPQMRDTKTVLEGLDLSSTPTKLLAIVANTRGAEEASKYAEITYLGFPLSISETFQKRNTNKTIAEALGTVNEIQNLCLKSGKQFVVYLSMAFGNPYGEPYKVKKLLEYINRLSDIGIPIISLSDTIGTSTPKLISEVFQPVITSFPHIELGAHLHSTPDTTFDKIKAAYGAGCTRFDGAIKGFGGCPMAKDDLVGNVATELLIQFFEEQGESTGIDKEKFNVAMSAALEIFSWE